MRSRLCCPCAGVWRQPERISHRQCCHSSCMRIWHGSGLWYRWSITKTPGDRQVKPLSNAALPAPPAAFKSPDGEQDGRGDEGSCGSRSEVVSVSGHWPGLVHGVQRSGELEALECAILLWGTGRTGVFAAGGSARTIQGEKLLPTYRPFCHPRAEPPSATTCKPGGRQGLAGPGRRRRALSACTSCIFG